MNETIHPLLSARSDAARLLLAQLANEQLVCSTRRKLGHGRCITRLERFGLIEVRVVRDEIGRTQRYRVRCVVACITDKGRAEVTSWKR